MSAVVNLIISFSMMMSIYLMMQSPIHGVIKLSDALPILLLSSSMAYGVLSILKPNIRPFGLKNHYALELFIFCMSISGFLYSQGDALTLLVVSAFHVIFTALLCLAICLFILPFIALWRYYKRHGHVYQ